MRTHASIYTIIHTLKKERKKGKNGGRKEKKEKSRQCGPVIKIFENYCFIVVSFYLFIHF